LGSNWFFVFTLLLFASEAGWLAITSRFPMAFDEAYHFGIIQFFGHHLNPLVSQQPASTYGLGAIAHDPSFLYHYLLSFPYRLVAHFSHSMKLQVIVLRFFSIAFMIGSLLIIRKTLRFMRIPAMLANIILLVFALTPIVTALAAQINYDNLLILMSSACIYQTLRLVQSLRRGLLDVKLLLTLACFCLYASVVKFTFLPFLIGIVAVVAWQLILYWRRHTSTFAANFVAGFKAIPRQTQAVLAIAGIIGLGLFINFYGYDLVKYHNPEPQCNQILSIQDCQHYYSWERNYTAVQYKKSHPQPLQMNPVRYTWFWFKVQYYQLFAEIVPIGGLVHIAHDFYATIIVLSVIGALCTLLSLPKILRLHKAFLALAAIVATYLLFLWARNYYDYRQLGQPLAIQGRYVVPVLVYMYALLGLGITYTLESKKTLRLVVRPAITAIVIFSFIYFGGYVRYVSNISPNDQWPAQPARTSYIITNTY
jgi:hypothetical protein